MVFLGKTAVTFRREVVIFAFGQIIWVQLVAHVGKISNFAAYDIDCFQIFNPKGFQRIYFFSVCGLGRRGQQRQCGFYQPRTHPPAATAGVIGVAVLCLVFCRIPRSVVAIERQEESVLCDFF